MFHVILGTVLGFVAGAFTPSVLRSVKAAFSADAKKGVSLVEGEVKAAEADIKAKL